MTTQTLTIGTATVPYRVFGSGPGLVFVHGTGRGSVTWDALIDRFTDRHTVILPDLSGSDLAVDDGSPLTLELLTGQLAAVIEDTGLGAVDVVGHSLGAVVAVALAATRPELVRRLVPLAGWTGKGDEYVRQTMEQFLALAELPEAFARYAMLTAYSHRYLNVIGSEAVDELARGFVPTPGRLRQFELNTRTDVEGLLPLVTAPTLVIGCTEDVLVPVANSRRLHAGIAGSEYAELRSGHVARVEAAGELVELVEGFLVRP
ncbi:alpha/beta fold hydrolase [Phytomonospora endophytica]|uniref:Pimeloyl-ACP methyl ester carboxylesterase n=1 Tax=Phytomonospora endophytica TaxID=714109 RepID=A0A841FYH4_9ACTN|nr:alpha/beta hydrolase [Phytomonospora endophytica]MBB6037489.1 pimeloyl-ACP methyl ester carboxylesterase [Phytomonospora endophytica]